MRDGEHGRYPIVTIREEGGSEFAVHAFHDVLKNELGKIRPEVGDEIGIAYGGKHPDRNYHQYRVASDRSPVAGIDWDSVQRESSDSLNSESDVPVDATGFKRPQADDDIPF